MVFFRQNAMQPRKILVVDDDPDIRAMIRSLLEADGYLVVEAASGEAALECYEQSPPELVVVDLMMPGLKGTEVAKKIREKPGGDIVPIMMLTAREGVGDKVSAFEGGVDEYITKPFNYQELQGRIRALLRIRDLNVSLQMRNEELRQMQEKLIQKERQALVNQLAGTTAHRLGQPLSAIMLNCHLLETLPQEDERYQKALKSIKDDSMRMAEIIAQLRSVDAAKKEEYLAGTEILELKNQDGREKE